MYTITTPMMGTELRNKPTQPATDRPRVVATDATPQAKPSTISPMEMNQPVPPDRTSAGRTMTPDTKKQAIEAIPSRERLGGAGLA